MGARQLRAWRKEHAAEIVAAKASGQLLRHKAFGTNPADGSLFQLLASQDNAALAEFGDAPEDGG